MTELTFVTGTVGGLVATVVMTGFMVGLGDDSPPPTAAVWAKYVGDGPPTDYVLPGMVLHLLYGIVAGLVFVLAVPALGVSIGSMSTAVLFGLIYGLVLFVGAAVFWMKLVLGMDPEIQQVVLFLSFHLVYGVVLGVWVHAGPI